MATDFCNDLWDTRIESDAVCSDGYEVTNLISRDLTKKQRGFLAERFVKPVVSILISFPFPIEVYAINVNPRVGGQKICGLEILAASLAVSSAQNSKLNMTCDTKKSELNSEVLSSKPDNLVFHLYPHFLNVSNIKQEFNSFFNQILRVWLAEDQVGNFLNPGFQDVVNTEFQSKIIGSSSGNVQTNNLTQGIRLRSISHLWIRITKVHKGLVPCFGALEVVGKPAKNNTNFVMDYARFISLRLKQEREFPKGFVNSSNETKLSTSTASTSELVSKKDPCNETSLVDNIPTEFIDPITFNIMTLPILLPSGNTIDNSTLEKHIAVEQKWGRQPTDPFTGLPLDSKLVPNAALKYRIDNFLLTNDINVDKLGRTIGSSSDCKSTVKLKFDAMLKRNKNKIKQIGKRDACAIGLKQPPSKRQNLGNDGNVSGINNSLDEALENVLNVRPKPTNTNSVQMSSLVPSSSFPQTEPEVQNAVLISLDKSKSKGCPHEEQTDVLFQLPCQHVICRQCLTCAVQTKRCLYCQINFERKDVVRVHSNRAVRIGCD